ncbi:MAG: hypothetical protein M5U09_21480 [Gammaproteobacteria bacterium]|nr:hypothetical protein [Gammaproteobacteria bacterium]
MKRMEVPSERERYWLAHVDACERSDQTSKAYAREHGLSVSMMYSWRKKLTARGLWSRGSGPCAGVSFERLEVVETAAPLAWRIVLPNGVEVGFSGVLDAAALAAVLDVARAL